MLIYNVTIKVDWSIHEDWEHWMKTIHIPEVMATGCFESYRFLRLLEVEEADGPSFAAQYQAAGREQYDEYINGHSASMRQKLFDKWGNRFIAFRTLMEVVH